MLELIQREVAQDPYYRNNFDNDGQKFVAWYLRRVLLRDDAQTRDDITDGANDKEVDAVIVDDAEERIVIIQGKFITARSVDGTPLQEVLVAWMRLQKLDTLQKDCNERLKKKIEAIRKALDEDYRVEFELLTTGTLTQAARDDLKGFTEQLAEFDEFSSSLHLIDTEMLTARLAEAENTVSHLLSMWFIWTRPKSFSQRSPMRTLLSRCCHYQSASNFPVSRMGDCLPRTYVNHLAAITKLIGS